MSTTEHILRVRRLYKLILRVHRALPEELRLLGDQYARDEFKRHKNSNSSETTIFLNEWTVYAINLAKQIKLQTNKNTILGQDLDRNFLDFMSDEQIVQLYELKKATEKNEHTDEHNLTKK